MIGFFFYFIRRLSILSFYIIELMNVIEVVMEGKGENIGLNGICIYVGLDFGDIGLVF